MTDGTRGSGRWPWPSRPRKSRQTAASPPAPAENAPASSGTSAPLDQDFAWRVHAATQDWIRGVDTKASITFVVITGLSVFFAGQLFGDKGSLAHPSGDQLWAVRATGLALGLAVLSALYAIWPSLEWKRSKQVACDGLIYFGHLRHRNAQSIEAKLQALTHDEIRRQLAMQLDITAKIAWRKHVRLRFAQLMTVLAVVGFVVAETVAV
jgi:hypothetical protein